MMQAEQQGQLQPPPTPSPIAKADTMRPTIRPPSPSPTYTPPEYYAVHGEARCVDASLIPKPYYITETFRNPLVCCSFSINKETCLWNAEQLGLLDDLPPSPTPEPAPDTVVDISVHGTLQVGNLEVPAGYYAEEWPVLKNVLVNTLVSVMMESPICHPGMSVELTTFGGQMFPHARRLSEGEKMNDGNNQEIQDELYDATNIVTNAKGGQSLRRAATAATQTLRFTMTIPTRCNEACQMARGHVGKLAFNELEEHFLYYIEEGVASSTLEMIGHQYGIAINRGNEPFLDSGRLTYYSGVVSSVTWIPTWQPTGEMPTYVPTSEPTENPSETPISSEPTPALTSEEPTSSPTTACSSLKWHYSGEYGGCSNDPDYPVLWDINPVMGAYFLFDSVEECCRAKSPLCMVKDICIPRYELMYCEYETEIRMYHPTTPERRACTNNRNYPPAWDHFEGFLFEDAADCCAEYYDDGLCLIRDVCV